MIDPEYSKPNWLDMDCISIQPCGPGEVFINHDKLERAIACMFEKYCA